MLYLPGEDFRYNEFFAALISKARGSATPTKYPTSTQLLTFDYIQTILPVRWQPFYIVAKIFQ